MKKGLFYIGLCLIFSKTLLADTKPVGHVLYIGDSHSFGAFGIALDKALRSFGTQVTSIASCGSSPSNWMSTSTKYNKTVCGYWRKDPSGKEIRTAKHSVDGFPQEISAAKPDLTVIELGTNILTGPKEIAAEMNVADKMLKQVEDIHSRCVWIGPPDAAKEPFKTYLPEGVAKIRELAGKHHCLFIDSSKMTHYPAHSADGIHYGAKEAATWADKVTTELLQWLDIPAHPAAKTLPPAIH